MNSFIKVPNVLFDFEVIGNKCIRKYPLKSIDLYVYLYLLASNFNNNSIKRKIKTIAERCNVKDNKTIHSSISRLEKMGLVAKKKRHNFFGINLSNAYSITILPGDFFMLDRRYLEFNLGTSAFAVLLYLNRCKSSNFACPSISKISKATGLSQPTIRNKIVDLQQHLYLSKVNVISQYGDFSNNNYYLNTYETRKELLKVYRKIKLKRNYFIRKFIKTNEPGIKKILGSFVFLIKGVGKLFPNTS